MLAPPLTELPEPLNLAIISDTHMPRGSRRLPPACVEQLRRADHIIHAGDFVSLTVLDELRALAPAITAVHGNVDDSDVRAALPERAELDLEGVKVGVIHDAGPRRGRIDRLRTAFPAAQAVIFGHSHIPLHERSPDGFQIFNPGSPTERRRSPNHTMGLATVAAGRISFRVVNLG